MTETEVLTENNLVNIDSHVLIYIMPESNALLGAFYSKHGTEIPFMKYNIKETDFRIKTATLTTPFRLDLTDGVKYIKVVSSLHENFTGIVLDNEYTENGDGTYSYQCQDMSRQYQGKFEMITAGDVTIHRILKSLLTRNGVGITASITDATKKNWKTVWSGLRPIGLYKQDLWNNLLNINTMEYKPKLIMRNKTFIEAIRDLTIGYMRYVDVYFDENGSLQIEPFARDDWLNTGLYLTTDEVVQRKFKFDTTNAITDVIVHNTDSLKVGTDHYSDITNGLVLSKIFGLFVDSIDNPNKNNQTTTTTNSSKAKSTTKKTATMKNPFNNKSKNIIVSADGGSDGFRKNIIKLLEKDGWKVTNLGTGPGTHSKSYNILAKKYAVNLTIYNGADPMTIKEPVTGWLKGRHEKYGVTLVQMFDTSTWTNPKGMKPYRYGNFSGYTCNKAWDDNYSGASNAQAKIKDLGAWYKKYLSKVKHCCGPTPQQAYNQFKAGGYFKYVNK